MQSAFERHVAFCGVKTGFRLKLAWPFSRAGLEEESISCIACAIQ
jgi:hypothetical protein